MKSAPWYKQFWPWFLIILPGSVVIASMVTIKIATDNPVSLVAEDYYKEGKAINQDLSRITLARNLGIVFEVKQQGDQLVFIQHGGQGNGEAIKVEFHHTTLAKHDQQMMLTQNGDGNYQMATDKVVEGKWQVMIDSFDGRWRLQQKLTLPLTESVWFR